jgi:hypothetical protein
MPAIHLPRLRKQVGELAKYCSEPGVFLDKLKDLFDYYGDRTLRPSQVAAKPIAIQAANVPRPVLRQIVTELTPYANKTPHIIIDLSRELWRFGWFEHRMLACQLVGKLPDDHAEEIILLIESWCQENHEEALLDAMSTRSLTALHAKNTPLLVSKAQEWIDRPGDESPQMTDAVKLSFQKLGLRSLAPLIEDSVYENLPKIYKSLKPILLAPPKILRPDLLNLLRMLGRRSPQETAYYLRNLLHESPTATLQWLVRRSLNTLPEDLQSSLRAAINPTKPSPN